MTSWPIFDEASKTFPIYSRANIGEIFPDPISPLNASAGFQANLEPGWRDAFVACGVWDAGLYDRAAEYNIVPAFGSYLYINMSLMRLFGVRVPGMSAAAVNLQYFGDMPGIPSYESEQRDFDEDPGRTEQAGAWLVRDVLGATDLAAYDADQLTVAGIRAQRPDLTTLPAAELRARISSPGPLLQRLFQLHIEASLKAGVGLGAIAQAAAAAGRPELGLALVSGVGDIDSTGPADGMWALSRQARTGPVAALFGASLAGLYERLTTSQDPGVIAFATEFSRFIADWDFRGPSEWELRARTWGTHPELALAVIERLRLVPDDQSPTGKNAERAEQRAQAAAAIRKLLVGQDEALAQFEAALRAAALWVRGRERSRTTAAMLLHELRLPALELGRRAAAAGQLDDARQVFMLFESELDSWLAAPAKYQATIREREQVYRDLVNYEPPFVTVGQPGPVSGWGRRRDRTVAVAGPGEVITGVPGCGGLARGVARVLASPDDPSALQPGDILVAPVTDPSWTPLFMSAAAVVVDVGAPFSHAAIISRELGIPCVVSATDATRRIPDGALIEVQGGTGQVTVLDANTATAP